MTCHTETTRNLTLNHLKEQLVGTSCDKQTLIAGSDTITERAPEDSCKKLMAESIPPPPTIDIGKNTPTESYKNMNVDEQQDKNSGAMRERPASKISYNGY